MLRRLFETRFGMYKEVLSNLMHPAVQTSCNEENDEAVTMDSLTEALFSLDEPWRGRFLSFVATHTTKWTECRQQPTPEEVTAWFAADPSLRRKISLLLYLWQGPWRRPVRLKCTFPAEHRRNRPQ
jgi:hypothetical protein